jgi:GDP-4-dehydro-6-deoxy-D-mannose reductase
MKILITGINGFVGKALVEFIDKIESEAEVYGIDIQTFSAIKNYQTCDITDFKLVEETIKRIKPDKIFHLAGLNTNNYEKAYAVNVKATQNILECIKEWNITTKTLIVGSAAEYGVIKENENPVSETNPLRPISIYGLTKAFQTLIAQRYAMQFGMNIAIARPSNIVGPYMPRSLVVGIVAEQLKTIKRKKADPVLSVGNILTKRDFVDVRDVVRAFWLLLQKPVKGDIFNIASNHPITIKSIIDKLLFYSKIEAKIEIDSNRIRQNDITEQYSDNSKIFNALGWKPEYTLDETIMHLVEKEILS